MHGHETVMMEKSCRVVTRVLRLGTGTLWRYVERTIVDVRHQTETEPTHCVWWKAFRRAGNRPHRPRMRTFGEGTRVDSQGFQLSNACG